MLMKYFLIFLLGFTALKLQAQTPAHYLFSAAIQQAADRDSNAWQLQNYAIKFSKTGNYQASLAEQQIFLDKTKAMRNAPDKPVPDSAWFAAFHPENAVAVIAREGPAGSIPFSAGFIALLIAILTVSFYAFRSAIACCLSPVSAAIKMKKLEPWPGVLSKLIRPPCRSINSLQSSRPRPTPFSLLVPKVDSAFSENIPGCCA